MTKLKASYNQIRAGLLAFAVTLTLSACTTYMQTCPVTKANPTGRCDNSTLNKKSSAKKDVASWYGKRFHHRRTASGERFNMYKLTAAHKTLPLSSYALVTNLRNSKQVIVKINDRGPFIEGRTIDLSYAAAKKLGMLGQGIAPVSIKPVAHG